jgi:Lipocalin-like domain
LTGEPVRSVDSVDLDRYVGEWFEVARFTDRFQHQCVSDVRATYTQSADGRIAVINRCRTEDGGTTEARGVARVTDHRTIAKLKVRFASAVLSFLPFAWGDYWILELASDLCSAKNHAASGSSGILDGDRRESVWPQPDVPVNVVTSQSCHGRSWRLGNPRTEACVRATPIVMRYPLGQELPQMPFIERNDVVETLSTRPWPSPPRRNRTPVSRGRGSAQTCATSATMKVPRQDRPPHVPSDNARRYGDAELQQQFRGNPFLTPGLIRSRHGGNQVLQVLRNPGTARAPSGELHVSGESHQSKVISAGFRGFFGCGGSQPLIPPGLYIVA